MVCLALAVAVAAGEPAGMGAGPKVERVLAPVVAYSSRGDNRIHLLNADDLSPAGSIDAGIGAHELAIAPGGRWVMGSAYGGPGQGHNPPDNRVVVLDLLHWSVHRTIELKDLQRPNDIAFLPGVLEAMVTVESPPHVVRINPETGEMTPTRIDRKAGHMLALSPDGSRAYVSHVVPGSVSVVDLKTGQTLSSIAVPMGAEGIAASPDGTRVWVASNRSGSISIIDTVKNEVVQTIECRGFPFRVRFSADGAVVAVSCPAAGEVALFDAQRPENVRRVNVRTSNIAGTGKGSPTSLAFVPRPDQKAGAAPERLAVLSDGSMAQVVLLDVKLGEVVARATAQGPIADGLTAGMALVARVVEERGEAGELPLQKTRVVERRPA